MLRHSPRAILTLTVLCASLPFANQAFHIDDRIYLEVADNILKQPFFPYDYPVVFEGLVTPDMASHSHLPLISYYLALLKLLTGAEKEWVFHLAFLIFPLIAAFAFHDLARRYVRFSVAAVCLMILSPAFLVLSHTLMTDLPFLAFWMLALSRFLRITEGETRTADFAIFALALLAVSFISLLGAGLILLLAIYLILRSREVEKSEERLPVKPLLCLLALPFLLWGLWYLRAYLHYDRFVLLNTMQHMLKREAFSVELFSLKALSFVLNAGAIFIFPPALWYAFSGRLSARIFLLIFYSSFVPFYIWFTDWSLVETFLFALFFSSGLTVLWQAARRCRAIVRSCYRDVGAALRAAQGRSQNGPYVAPARQHAGTAARRHDGTTVRQTLLVLWFLGALLAYCALYYAGSARYALLALPPVILWWVAALEKKIEEPYFLRNLIWLGVLLTALYSFPIAYGDYRFAEVHRQTANQIVRDYSRPGQSIWFTAEWGFRYYLEKAGARLLLRTTQGPEPGDIIVKPYIASPWVTLYDGDEYTELLEQRYAPRDYPVRILDFASKAGFYSTGWGILPFSLNYIENWEWFNIFRVRRKYEGPIPEPEKHF